MLYRNKKTGLELELKSVIISPDFELVSKKKKEPCENISDEEMFSKAPVEEAPIEEPSSEEAEEKSEKKDPVKKTSSKKKGTKK